MKQGRLHKHPCCHWPWKGFGLGHLGEGSTPPGSCLLPIPGGQRAQPDDLCQGSREVFSSQLLPWCPWVAQQ